MTFWASHYEAAAPIINNISAIPTKMRVVHISDKYIVPNLNATIATSPWYKLQNPINTSRLSVEEKTPTVLLLSDIFNIPSNTPNPYQ